MAWKDDFFEVHQRWPNAQDIADREWSLQHQAATGSPPTDEEWQQHHYETWGGGGGAGGGGATGGGGGGGDGGGGGGGVPYGGSAWMQQLEQQIWSMLQAAMQQGMATGYMTPLEKPLTETDALAAIYQAKPKLQEQHETKYSDWSVTKYMRHWLEETGELQEGREWTDAETGVQYRNIKDQTAIEFAISHGYLNPGPNPQGPYGIERVKPELGEELPEEGEIDPATGEPYPPPYRPPGYIPPGGETDWIGITISPYPWERWPEKEKTLEREAFEAGQEQWQQEYLRSLGLDEEAIRQFDEAMKLQRDQFEQGITEADRQFLRAQGLDEEDIRRWEAGQETLKEATAEDKRRWNEEFARAQGLDDEAIRQFNDQMDFSRYQADQAQRNFQTELLRQQGLDTEAIRQFDVTARLAREQFDAGNDQWKAQFGLEREYFDEDKKRWKSEFDLGEQQWGKEFLRAQGLDEEDVRRWELEQDRLDELSDEEKRRWNDEFLRAQGIDEENIRQFDATHRLAMLNYQAGNEQWRAQFQLEQAYFDEEKMRWQSEFEMAESQWSTEFLRQQGLDEEDIRRWELDQEWLAKQTAEDKRRYEQEFLHEVGIDEEAIRQFNATHELALLNYQAGNQQWQAELGLQERIFNQQTGQWEQEFAWGQTTWQADHDQRVQEWQDQFGLNKWQAEEAVNQWEQQFGLTQEQFALTEREFERGGYQWGQEFGLDVRQQQALEQQQAHQQRMEELALLAGLKGPENWLQYAATARALPGGQELPSWQGDLAQQVGYGPEAAAPAPAAETPWQIQPQQVTPAQYYGLPPGLQSMFQGLVQAPEEIGGYGGFWPDFQRRMEAGWATGGPVQGTSWWGG